jgi:hypothetical protein
MEKAFPSRNFRRCTGPMFFYAWFGLDNPLVYAAHRAAGGMTSVYRQIGIGCEELLRTILVDELGLTPEQVKWSYTLITEAGTEKELALDSRIPLQDVQDRLRQATLTAWLRAATEQLAVDDQIRDVLRGPVFEVRQGYKSKDSKRQNADMQMP